MVFSIREDLRSFGPRSCQRECETKYDTPSTPRRDGAAQRSTEFISFNYSVPDLCGSVTFGLPGSGKTRSGSARIRNLWASRIRMQPILQNIMLTILK